MRLAIVNNNLGKGGAEKLIYDMALYLKNKKIEFSVILLTSVNCYYGEKLIRKGIDVKYLSNIWDIYSIKNIVRLYKILKDYDIVHTHIYSSQIWTAFASFFLPSKIKFITTEHSTNNRRRKIKIFKYIDAVMYNQYDNVVSISMVVYDELNKWVGKLKKESSIIENGINIEEILNEKSYLRKDFNLSEKDILISQVARFEKVKNHKTIIYTLKKLPTNYKVIFLGEGKEKEKIVKLIKDNQLEERIIFLGYRSDSIKIIKMCDIVILTSKYEGLPLSAIESMLLKPFIGSDVPGIKELVKEEEQLFEYDNSEQLAEIILKLIEDKKYYKLIQKKCKETAMKYSIEGMMDKYLQIYKVKNKI